MADYWAYLESMKKKPQNAVPAVKTSNISVQNVSTKKPEEKKLEKLEIKNQNIKFSQHLLDSFKPVHNVLVGNNQKNCIFVFPPITGVGSMDIFALANKLAHLPFKWVSLDSPFSKMIPKTQMTSTLKTFEDYVSVELLAAASIKIIKTYQESGPYYFFGYSFGGLIAFEAARQFEAEGIEVKFLGSLDSRGPSAYTLQRKPTEGNLTSSAFINEITSGFSETMSVFNQNFFTDYESTLIETDIKDLEKLHILKVVEKVHKSMKVTKTHPRVEIVLKSFYFNMKALVKYRIQPSAMNFHLSNTDLYCFLSEDRLKEYLTMDDTLSQWDNQIENSSPIINWKRHIAGCSTENPAVPKRPLNVYPIFIKGMNHTSVVQEPTQLAESFEKAIKPLF